MSDIGVLERRSLKLKAGHVIGRINKLKKQNVNLESSLHKYRNGYQSPEEMIDSGFAPEEGQVIRFIGLPDSVRGNAGLELNSMSQTYLRVARIVWIVFSAAIMGVMVYFHWKNINRNGNNHSDAAIENGDYA